MQILQIMFLLFYMTAPRVQMCTQLKMEICFQISTIFVLLHLNKAILVRRAEPLSSYLNWICYLYWTFTSVVIVEWSVQKNRLSRHTISTFMEPFQYKLPVFCGNPHTKNSMICFNIYLQYSNVTGMHTHVYSAWLKLYFLVVFILISLSKWM